MPEQNLAKKMKLKTGRSIAILNAPERYLEELMPLPFGVTIVETGNATVDWVQIFVKNQAELEKVLPKALKRLKPESILWISYPKKTSEIQTDFTRDTGWGFLQDKELKWLTLVSVNESWSAFAMRYYKEGEKRQTFV